MNDTEDFEKRSKALFDASVDDVNGNIRSRLTQARHTALAATRASQLQSMRRWLPAAGLAAAALIAVVIVKPFARHERALPDSLAAADDLALLLNDDDIELIQDMEFYAWLDSDPQALPQAPTGDDDATT